MEANKRNTERRGSFVILSIAIIFIVLIVVSGICVNFFLTDEFLSKIILLVLLALIIVVGIVSFVFLECQKRYAAKRYMDRAADQWVRMTLAEQTQRNQSLAYANAPPETTWAYTTPWRHSKASTARPS